MKTIARILLGLALSIVMTGSAFALGLGNASGLAILGEPLRVEIPLIGSETGVPAIECFNLRAPQAEIANIYVLRNAQLQLLGESGRARLVVTSSSPVQEPVIEFAVAVGCGFELSKDYLLLAEEPGRVASTNLPALQPVATIMKATGPAPAPVKPASRALPSSPPGEALLRVDSALTLAALAHQKYPLQPKAREKFLRLMLLANPDLKRPESLIESGTDLHMPPGLPLRRLGSLASRLKPAVADAAGSRPLGMADRTPASGHATGAATKPAKDLLVLGAPLERNRNAAELLAEAERLAAILLDQTRTQDALAEKIGKLDDTLNELKKHFIGLTDRLNKIEAERQAEKLVAKPASLDFLELLLAVGAGGLMGALGLYVFNRRQFQPGLDAAPTSATAASATPNAAPPRPLPRELKDFDLAWSKPPSPNDPPDSTAIQGPAVGTRAASPVESTIPAASAQNDFDFSMTTPPSSPGQGGSPDQTIRKVSP
ncbi:MAG: hypothetical protein D4R84_06875 [Rhodocyclaceae bacterium]|nr:MAG: hypothetical protein D4R84_06875 [Rhodocyclaceae bacterium]